MSDTLELEEGDLFEQPSDLDCRTAAAAERMDVAPGAAYAGGASDDDEEDALDLELDTSDSERLAQQLASLHSSVGHSEPIEASSLAVATGAAGRPESCVGSLKRLQGPGLAPPPAADGSVAASVPARPTPIARALRRDDSAAAEQDVCSHLGTSMPIRIPLMHRRGLAASPGSWEGRGTEFVPPHLLDLHADATADGSGLASFKESPSQAVKREKLVHRNAILRSTGFIEVQSAFAASSVEVLDVVKESGVLVPPEQFEGPVPRGGAGLQRRPTAASSLTSALLSSSR